jgi:hypothetical protein
MIARLPKLPMLIAKTSRVFLEKYPAYSSEQLWQNFAVGWGKARAGLRFDEGNVMALGGRSLGLIPGHQ